VARSMKLPLSVMNVENLGSTDSERFRAEKIRAITLHSLATKSSHSKKDDFPPVTISDYCDSARLIAAYVAYLDTALKIGGDPSSPAPASGPASSRSVPAKPPAPQR
jgi:hypothetical protein